MGRVWEECGGCWRWAVLARHVLDGEVEYTLDCIENRGNDEVASNKQYNANQGWAHWARLPLSASSLPFQPHPTHTKAA